MHVTFEANVDGVRLDDPFVEEFGISGDQPVTVILKTEVYQYPDGEPGTRTAAIVDYDIDLNSCGSLGDDLASLWQRLTAADPKSQFPDAYKWINPIMRPGFGFDKRVARLPTTDHSVPEVRFLDQRVRAFFADLDSRARSSLVSLIDLIHWRMGSYWFSNQVTDWIDARWALDSSTWMVVPLDDDRLPSFHEGGVVADRFVQGRVETVRDRISTGQNAPTSFSLLREASSIRTSSNRAACMVAWTAIEVACKEFVEESGESYQWMANSRKMPYFPDFCKHLLPLLLVERATDYSLPCVPQFVIEGIVSLNKERNKSSHEGRSSWGDEEISRCLEDVNDFIWILQFYGGHTWATRYMSDRTLREMSWTHFHEM